MPREGQTRRPPVAWDHRKDKYMLLEIFSQLNIRSADYGKLAEMLGNDPYSAENLKRRFRALRQTASEIYEDRQDQQAGAPAHTIPNDPGDEVLEEPVVETSPPSLSTPVPTTPAPARHRGRGAVEPTPPSSGHSGSLRRARKVRSKTAPPAARVQDDSSSPKPGRAPEQPVEPTLKRKGKTQTRIQKPKNTPKSRADNPSSKTSQKKDERRKRNRGGSKKTGNASQEIPANDSPGSTPEPTKIVTPRSSLPIGMHLRFDDDMSIRGLSEAPEQPSAAQPLQTVSANEERTNGARPKDPKRPWRQAHYGMPYDEEYEKGYNEFVFASTGGF